MLRPAIVIAIYASTGAAWGYFGPCLTGKCPLTASWWRGALYGAFLGLLLSIDLFH